MLALLPALLAWGRAAREAQARLPPAAIRMNVESCPAPWDAEIRVALALELGDERLAAVPTGARPAAPDSSGADGRPGTR